MGANVALALVAAGRHSLADKVRTSGHKSSAPIQAGS